MQQSVVSPFPAALPVGTPPEGAHEASASVGAVVSMAEYGLPPGMLSRVQSSGTLVLTPVLQSLADENVAAPPEHFPCGAPHAQALHPRVSS